MPQADPGLFGPGPVTRQPHGAAPRPIPAGVRRQPPARHIPRAVDGLGAGTRPSVYNLHRRAAILDGPGEARGIDGGGGAGWRTPG
ncbi:hypothetical protein [Streptomyces klenkii]|uniref:hypothetical protein n=1 Tax=Streptomyces klenkii TaxID=1420899 RepID=UPI00341ADEAC